MTDLATPSIPSAVTPLAESTRTAIGPKISASPARTPKSPSRPTRFAGHTTKRYQLADDAHRKVAQLRQILNQKALPGEALVTFADGAITLEWDE